MGNPLTLTSDVINYLIYRYLQESGFSHTAFAFGHESSVTRTPIDPNNVPPGSLITFVQKGLQYLELEANIDSQDGEVDGEFKMLTPDELLCNNIDQLRMMVLDRKEERAKGPEKKGKKEKKEEKKEEPDNKKEKAQPSAPTPSTGPTPMEEDAAPSSSVTTLTGHESEVYSCAWSPTELLLASGSGDSTARIWNLAPGSNFSKSVVLHHEVKQDAKDITTLDWNQDGSLLGTGSYDGMARIWTKEGKLKQTLDKHHGPIFALKWNKKGDLLLSGSVDKTAIVWDAKLGEVKQIFEFHTAPTLDLDWRNNTTFASCSTDKLIYVCKLGETAPVKTFKGHTDEINAVRWDPSGKLLASCSDDRTAKVWSLSSGTDKCLHDFKDHSREIYTCRWSPTGAGSANPNLPLLLATASFDHTVKLWDVEAGKCVNSLEQHTQPVYSVSFSPNGKLVATGSFDRNMHVWSVEDGSLIRTFRGEAGIYEVCWSKEGERLAACYADHTLCVVDLRM
eukprot:gene20287-27045_t